MWRRLRRRVVRFRLRRLVVQFRLRGAFTVLPIAAAAASSASTPVPLAMGLMALGSFRVLARHGFVLHSQRVFVGSDRVFGVETVAAGLAQSDSLGRLVIDGRFAGALAAAASPPPAPPP
jgi:hypothetical protein